jgi:hypothetical protein
MAFDWRDFLELARFLQSQSNIAIQEAAQRSSVSRAYYAAFCHARNYTRDQLGFSPYYHVADHQLVRDCLRSNRMGSVATCLDKLRQWRNDCDYDDVLGNLPSLVSRAISKSSSVLTSLR